MGHSRLSKWAIGDYQKQIGALERAERFRRWKAADVRAILAAGGGLPTPASPGEPLVLDLPAVPARSLSSYALEALR